ncbi:MAG: sigma-70 family RNA polymerase sigma factor [Bryobacterales bacterium]|nr:sigma-70 family RNA polymerase sigma factor [Bryobacterales bacterium]
MDESETPGSAVSLKMAAAAQLPVNVDSPVRIPVRSSADSGLADLIHRIAAGQQEALGTLYDQTNHLVYSVALRILGDTADAEEATLDAYSQVWRTAASYQASRGSAVAWLMTITRTRSMDKRRSRVTRNNREAPLDVKTYEFPSGAGDYSVSLDMERRVQSALSALAPEQKQAIEMAYFSGFSHSELALKLGAPLGTVKTRIRLGMIRLKALLAPLEPGENWSR